MSTISTMSTQGMMKKTPGPLAPPDSSRPRRNMTALSYSWWCWLGSLSSGTVAYLDDLDNEHQGEGESNYDEEDGE